MSSFFETDRDEFVFGGKTYQDYFNLYPNLWYKATLNHIANVDDLTTLNQHSDSEGWKIAVEFRNIDFLINTHYSGTSTLFCVAPNTNDQTIMLGFLGCFLPVIRDDWPHPPTNEFEERRNLISRLLGW